MKWWTCAYRHISTKKITMQLKNDKIVEVW